jgi:hypothetical protein
MTTDLTALEGWLAEHPYLREVARLQQAIEDSLIIDESSPLPPLQWDSLSADFEKGTSFFINRELGEAVTTRAAVLLARLAKDLSGADTNEEMKRVAGSLHDLFQSQPDSASTLVKQAAAGALSGWLWNRS